MKLKLLPLLLLALASAVFAQTSVVVTPKKTVYRRPKPIQEFKKTFTVTYPQVKAATPAVSRKIEAALSYEKNFEISFKEEMGEVQWLEEADYKVLYNQNGILTVNLFIYGTGAYPDGSEKKIVVDTKTGNVVKAADVFANTDGLIARLKEMQQAEIKKGIDEIKKDTDAGENPEQLFESADFTAENLNGFAVTEQGVTFYYDYGFPHVIQALEPDGEFSLSWAELKPFVKPDGLLGGFVR